MKKLISIILLMVLALTLSGCGKESKRYDEFTGGIEDVIEYSCWREGATNFNKKRYCTVQDQYGEETVRVSYEQFNDIKEAYVLKRFPSSYYTQEEVDEMLLELESNRTQFDNLKWDDDTEFWLVRIVSRTIVDTEFTYLYEIEEVGDEDYIVEFYTNDLFSINELALGVETRDEIFLIDFNNGDVVIPIENGDE